jgi:hypothetical protein
MASLSLVLVMFSLFCSLPCLRGVFELAPSVSNVLIICPLPCLRTPRRHGSGQIMRTLLTLVTNSSTPRRHGSAQNNENITNTRDKLEHVFVECSSWPLMLGMFSLFCPLPCLGGVLEFVPRVSNIRGQLEHSTKTWKWKK